MRKLQLTYLCMLEWWFILWGDFYAERANEYCDKLLYEMANLQRVRRRIVALTPATDLIKETIK